MRTQFAYDIGSENIRKRGNEQSAASSAAPSSQCSHGVILIVSGGFVAAEREVNHGAMAAGLPTVQHLNDSARSQLPSPLPEKYAFAIS